MQDQPLPSTGNRFVAHRIRQGIEHCNLCLLEKFAILTADPKTTLNKETELIKKCRTPLQIQIEESKIMTTCIVFEPNSHISLSFLHCIQLYADVICRVVL